MKRKFTFILTGLMLLAVGVNAEPVSLKTNGGQNVWKETSFCLYLSFWCFF